MSPTPSPERRAHFDFRIPPNADAEALARRRRERRKRTTNPATNSGSEYFEDDINKHEAGYDEDAQPDQYINGGGNSDVDPFINEYGQAVYGDVNREGVYESTEDIHEELGGDGENGEYAVDEVDEPDEDGQDDNELQDEDEPQDTDEQEQDDSRELQDDDELQGNDDELQGDDDEQDDDEEQEPSTFCFAKRAG